MARKYSSTSTDTTLASPLGSSATTCTVVDAIDLLGGVTLSASDTFTVALSPDTSSEEIVLITNVSSNTLTITRAQAGTVAVAHDAGTTVRHVLTSLELGEFATQAGTETLTNKTINLTNNTLTGTTAQFNTALSDGNFVTQAGTETLTNKTLTAPVISTISNTGTVTLPTSTDTLVGRNTTDTLTNKTIALGSNTVSGTLAQFNTAITDNDITPLNITVNAQTGTTYTFVLADSYKLVTFDNANTINVTVPLNSSVAFPTGTQIHFTQKGNGQVVVAGAVGVTVNTSVGLKTRNKWSTCSLIKIDTDAWIMIGDMGV